MNVDFLSPQSEKQACSVSELTQRLRNLVEPAFLQVWVKGEVSNYKPAASGHVYFSLKDSSASLSAAFFGWNFRKNRSFELKEGLEVLCRGKITLYPPRGSYQLVIEAIEPLGLGSLQVAFEALKEKLQKEGLFESALKRSLPRFPRRIGVITSPTGAVLQDLLKILKRRAPGIEVYVIPSLVQGKEAAEQLTQGVIRGNELNFLDLLVLARGGGSTEDLWAFNDETLARTIRKSRLPLISAVGHEVDFTIADFVADLRAPTPSAAAEILSEGWVQAEAWMIEFRQRFERVFKRDLQHRKQVLEHLRSRLINPKDRLREQAQRLDEVSIRLQKAVQRTLERNRQKFQNFINQLNALSPLKVLERGFSLVQEVESDQIIRSVKDFESFGEKTWRIRFYDGESLVRSIQTD